MTNRRPRSSQNTTGGQRKDKIENRMDRLLEQTQKPLRRREKVAKATDRHDLPDFVGLKVPKQLEKRRVRRIVRQHLGNKENVRDEGRVQNDRHVTAVQKLDGIRSRLSTSAHHLDGNIDLPSLDVAARDKDEHRREEIANVGQILAIQRNLESSDLILASIEQMEQREQGPCSIFNNDG